MSSLIEKGRKHRFLGAAAHMLVFLFFYLLYLLIMATMGVRNPFYPFDWAARRSFLYFWVPVLIVRLCNCNITAGCMTVGYFLGLIIGIPVGRVTYREIYYNDGTGGFYTTNYEFIFWFCFVLFSITAGIILEVRYRKQKAERPADTPER